MINYIALICLSLALVLVFLLYFYPYYLRWNFLGIKSRVAFNNVYRQSSPRPKYKMEFSYGWPHFTVAFRSDSELATAHKDGRNQRFSNEIEELCKNIVSEERPFQVERAIFYTSEEYLENLHKKYSQ